MTRRSQTYGVAGNCCCLVPVVILLAVIVLVVIGTAIVWHGAAPSDFRGGPGHHHSDAYRDGYQEGNRLGADYARRGDPEPTGHDLDALALREADRLHVRWDRGHWIEGFRNGFTRGFRNFSSETLNKQAGWSGLAAGREFTLKLA